MLVKRSIALCPRTASETGDASDVDRAERAHGVSPVGSETRAGGIEPVRRCCEAGPGGYALQRPVTTPRVTCQVRAPALIPRKPGERLKTN